jgi:hypothetical protein
LGFDEYGIPPTKAQLLGEHLVFNIGCSFSLIFGRNQGRPTGASVKSVRAYFSTVTAMTSSQPFRPAGLTQFAGPTRGEDCVDDGDDGSDDVQGIHRLTAGERLSVRMSRQISFGLPTLLFRRDKNIVQVCLDS